MKTSRHKKAKAKPPVATRDDVANSILADNMRNFRWTLGLTQQALAERLAVQRSRVSNWEGRRNSITLQQLTRIADAFGVEPWVLIKPGMKLRMKKISNSA